MYYTTGSDFTVKIYVSTGMLQSSGGPAKIVDLCEVKDGKSLVVLLKQVHREYRNGMHGPNTSLIIDGKAVSAVMKSIKSKRRLAEVANEVKTLIACRLSPVQKCLLVRMMKDSHKGAFEEDDGYDNAFEEPNITKTYFRKNNILEVNIGFECWSSNTLSHFIPYKQ